MGQSHVDLSVPSAARMYDWLLDGTFNYEADRAACRELLKRAPTTKALARNNRWFLERVVHTLADEYQVRRFLDFGSGLPTQNNVHQVAQTVAPDARVVYVDNDPVVRGHGRSLLDANANTAMVAGDMRDPDAIFAAPEVRRLFTDDQSATIPRAALFISVLHCIKDVEDPAGIVRQVTSHLSPGDYVVICHLVSDDRELRDSVTDLMQQETNNNWGRVREQHEVEDLFEGLQVLSPGLVDVTDWRPDSDLRQHQRSIEWYDYGGLAQVPASEAISP
ncbi:SAM-dependent methyltransferase [Streptomyces alfalfae]|uniref:SAM-dependent methyltransferase n=1 Tax=Streptomyces alfalfae TaxID=1642299 RepID=A0A7T4PPV8_9ACTN|nr:SAM-dependent methyltransferase [Streptomyces alfalfae]QQC94134.1 SAM-dependent methyltransferase [Streptomyces alfalfae]